MKNGGSLEKLQSGDPAAVQAMMGKDATNNIGGFGAQQQQGQNMISNMPFNNMLGNFGGLGSGANGFMMANLQEQMMKKMQ